MCAHHPSSMEDTNVFINDFLSFVAVLTIDHYQGLSRHLLKANVKHELISSNDEYLDVNDKFRIHVYSKICIITTEGKNSASQKYELLKAPFLAVRLQKIILQVN